MNHSRYTYLTVKEYADLKKVKPATVREWCKSGQINAERPGGVGTTWRIPVPLDDYKTKETLAANENCEQLLNTNQIEALQTLGLTLVACGEVLLNPSTQISEFHKLSLGQLLPRVKGVIKSDTQD